VIRVVKIGGRAQADPALAGVLASLTLDPRWRLCVVHGGGEELTDVQRQFGREARFVGGRRYTSPEDIDVVRMVLSGMVNKRLVSQLLNAGVPAVGVSGEDGGLLPAMLYDDGRLGAVGRPELADRRLLDTLLGAGFVPVISPVGRDVVGGEGLNVNGDDAAAAIAESVSADELHLVVDVSGVLDNAGTPLRSVDVDDIESLLTGGVARGGMAAKLQAARRAVTGGVPSVRIGDVLSLQDRSRGTAVTHSPSTVLKP
jgi:acetylglutamate kinase